MGEVLSVCVSEGTEDKTIIPPLKLERYRVVGQSGATVRKDLNLDSPLVANLEKDTIVEVSQVKGRRAHIVSPVDGWASIKTETGYAIIKKEDDDVQKYKVVNVDGAIIRAVADPTSTEIIGKLQYTDTVEGTGEQEEVLGIIMVRVATHSQGQSLGGWVGMHLREENVKGAPVLEKIV